MRSVLLGSRSQLAGDLQRRLGEPATLLAREQADLTHPAQVRAVLAELRPQVVFNCAAYNQVDVAEQQPEAAFAVNAWGVWHLAQTCRELGALLVHFSTNYVFGLQAERSSPYREEDAPGPVNLYGVSKLTGEYLLRQVGPEHLIVRTCGLFGLHGTRREGRGNFVEKMLAQAQEGRPIRVVMDQVCTPSYTADVAEAAVQLVRRGCRGLFHVTNSGSCSWYEFACELFRQQQQAVEVLPVRSEEYAAPARRPAYSVLDTRAAAAAGVVLRPWQEALAAYLKERDSKK